MSRYFYIHQTKEENTQKNANSSPTLSLLLSFPVYIEKESR